MRVLIIEDDRNYADLVTQALGGLASPAQHAASWEDAEQYLDATGPDVAWVDLRLIPGVGEQESAARIKALKKRYPEIVIIVGSGYITPQIREDLKDFVDAFLYKGTQFEARQIASLIVQGMMRASARGNSRLLLDQALAWMHAKFPSTNIV